ncbi:MAG: 50S ribosomal protein L10 [Thermoplasmatota archaeon]
MATAQTQSKPQGAHGHSRAIAPWKSEEVADLVRMLREYPVIGIANVGGIPAAQMAKMRKSLRADAEIRVVKNTLLTLALKEAAKDVSGLDQLVAKMDGQTAIIATKMNPFKLYKKLEQAKTKAPARGGEVAPADVEVKKGETQFKPGPIVGELQKAGIPAKIDQGKVMISQDKVLVKAGARIPQEMAQMLTRLEIYPLIVGMDLKAAYEEGMVYGPNVLSVDEEQILGQLKTAALSGLNVAVFVAWTTPQTIRPILGKAFRSATAVALEAAFPEKGTVDLLVAKGYRSMLAVAQRLGPEALDEDLKGALASRPAAQAAAAPAHGESKKEEPKEEKVSEEEAAGGLGALFG